MAGVFFTAAPGAVAIASATARTVIQLIAASSHRVHIHQIELAFNGVTAADPPALVELLVQTDAGTMSSLTLAKYNAGDDETLQTTAQHTSTVAPTTTTLKWSTYVHPQTGGPFVFKIPFVIPGGTRVGLRVTPGTMTGCNVSATILCEE